MADYGHKETDKRLAVMEKRIAKVYADTLAEAQDKLSAVLAEFRELDEKKAQAVVDGKLSKKAYTAWRKELIGKEKHLRDMIDVLTEDFTNADKIAMKIVNGEAKDVYALNANFAAYDIEKKANVNLSWTLYDHSTVERLIREEPNLLPLPSVDVPVDKRWNQKHITAAINRGILLGDPIQDIAKRLVTVASMDLNAAVRSARTATTAAECAGRIDTYKYAQSIGIEMQQEWVATLDDRTRHEHRILDGQRVDIGEAFEVDGASIRYPGDPQAPGYLIYNCRCTVIGAIKGLEDDDSDDHRKHMIGTTYEEWKAGKEQESVEKSGKSGIIASDKSDSVSARNTAVGKPKFVNAGAPLSKKQNNLLNRLQNDGDLITVNKRDCGLKDIAALSAHEGVEFALLTRKGERMVFRGNDHHVNSLNGLTVPQYRDAGWKWSGHTHVYGGTIPSDGDLKILKLFNQNQSAIYDYRGERGMVFNDEAKMD
jgi:uncharacterized protein with gpF-like domain|nr:MAG TPA: minor capsid protein [Caudoviricetes sp.]